MEDYAAKMALKSEAELQQYVVGYAQYREAAVLAALAELRQRGQPAPEEPELRPQLEAAAQQAQAVATARQVAAAQEEDAELPQLYSPAGIVVISVMFSVVAGAVLLALNLRKLKRNDVIIGLAAFVVAYLIGEALLYRWLIAQHMFSPLIAFLVDLPIIIAYVWWFWPRYVATYQFQPRNWLLPLGICLLLKFAFAYLLLQNPATAQLLKQQLEQMQQH